MKSSAAVLYLRSSKDRSDVSIDAQRRELAEFARSRSLAVLAEYADVVVSGKDENRPAFQRLLAELKSPRRAWSAILMLDTSRLSRNQYVAHSFRHEAKKRGVAVLFAKMPELDGVAAIMLPAMMHAMDEVHSFMSREKGLAGMSENVRKGFRAGGRAPAGYVLRHVDTGTVREGRPVLKSRLEPGPDAARIAAYLRARAAGERRAVAARLHGVAYPGATLIGIEWNALTYAGHTVWNVHRAAGSGASKRRPRAEWQIQRGTHDALITEAEAEQVLARLPEPRGRYRTGAAHLLTGLLHTPAGSAWHGDGAGVYRAGRGRRVAAAEVDRAILAQVLVDLRSSGFAGELLADARRRAIAHEALPELDAKRAAARALEARIRRAGELALEAPAPRAFYQLIADLEAERDALQDDLQALEFEAAQRTALSAVTERDIERALARLAADIEAFDREQLKDFLATLIERIDLDPDDLAARIHYKVRAEAVGNSWRPHGDAAESPVLRAWRDLKVA